MPTDSPIDVTVSGDPLLGSRVQAARLTTNGTYNRYNVTLSGGSGDDTIYGYSGPINWPQFNPTGDALHPLTVRNVVMGGAGSDSLNSSVRLTGLTLAQLGIYDRADTLLGGEGDDTYTIRDSNVTVTDEAGALGGIDTIVLIKSYTTKGGLYAFDMTLAAYVENLTVRDLAQSSIAGSALDNVIRGGTGTDSLWGNDGSDTLYGGNGQDQLFTGSGNNQVYGGGNADSITGDTGNDNLQGGAGSDTITDAGGSNSIDGGAGDDQLFGGTGADTLNGGLESDSLVGNAGNDSLLGGALFDRLFGGDGDDKLYGGDDRDTLDGQAGTDTVFGDDGNDQLSGGTTGLDLLSGGLGDDTLNGGADANTLRGDEGNDLLTGSLGNDMLIGGAGADRLFGGADADTLLAGSEDDRLYGGEGADQFTGGLGNDTMEGGNGNDLFNVDVAGDQVTELALGGTDTVASATIGLGGAAYANVEVLQLTGSTGLALTGGGQVVWMIGNAGNNQITGADASESLDGGAGHDMLMGGLGNDTVHGGEGNDTLTLNIGLDSLYGDAGDDHYLIDDTTATLQVHNDAYGTRIVPAIYYVPALGDTILGPGPDLPSTITVVEEANAGFDTITTSTLNLNGSDYAHVEQLQALGTADLNLTSGADTLVLIGNSGTNTLTGGANAETIDGGGGTTGDTLIGGFGNDFYILYNPTDCAVEFNVTSEGMDTIASYCVDLYIADHPNVEVAQALGTANIGLFGSADPDLLLGNSGDNVMLGGSANDTLQGGTGNDTLQGDEGADLLQGGAGNDRYVVGMDDTVQETGGLADWDVVSAENYDLDGTLYTNIEGLLLLGSNAMTATGGGSIIAITGNNADNVLTGGTATETISGADGADTLTGNAGDDVLYGGEGADLLYGGSGNNHMTGGAGADIFAFDSACVGDMDRIHDFDAAEDKIDLRPLNIQAYNTATQGYLGGGQPSIVVFDDGTDTTIALDTDGNGTTDQQIVLTGIFDLLALDAFVLI